MIRTVYDQEPKFPATDQHPDALRTQISGYWVDYIGTAPTLAEVQELRPALTKRRTLAAVMADIQALSTADRSRLIVAVCAFFLIEHPKFARALNIAVDGDEPA